MKKYLITTILGLSFMVLCQDTTFAQWDYGQDSIYNIVDSRIDRRKTAARIRARQAANKTAKTTPFAENHQEKIYAAIRAELQCLKTLLFRK